MTIPKIQLSLTAKISIDGLRYQQLEIEIITPDRVISPSDMIGLELPATVDTSGGVVISGRAPIWLYAYFVHELHPTKWVACFDPRLSGGVVVATHSNQAAIGQIILEAPNNEVQLCPALMIVGPPNSGKSVLSHALFQALLQENPHVYLQRANWDGEGNWTVELGDEEQAEVMKVSNKGELTQGFFPYHAQAILELRRQKSLVIVDIGGMAQPEKQPILEACSHYLIITSDPDQVDKWYEFCRDRGNLSTVAVIHSTLDTSEEVTQSQPYLEMTCGAWLMGQPRAVPDELLKRVRSLLLKR
ncbi:MAG: CRISPR-associated protein Csx3 [Oscillatoriales cyanobacterium CG2_30_44_21]|nr:MAG: CRISPR-associated protein Csx3 [Oscillatoriales cyanobacterium CG2_30_44_21]